MTERQWADYYNAIAAQAQADAVAQSAGTQQAHALAAQRAAYRQAAAQHEDAKQKALWVAPQPAAPPASPTQHYRKEGSWSSELQLLGSSTTTAELHVLVLAVIAILCAILIVVILAGLAGWPFNIADAFSGERKAKGIHDGKDHEGHPVGNARRSDRLIVPKRKLANAGGVVKAAEFVHGPWSRDAKSLSRRRRPAENPCGPVKFKYCAKGKRGFFYNMDKRDCQSTQDDGAMYYVCPRSRNRFTSRRSCKDACVKRNAPLAHCWDKPVFMGCARIDMKHSWWYRNGSRCVEWDFRKGRCAFKNFPMARSYKECKKNCLDRETNRLSCSVPTDVWCSATDLKFPYFAFPSVKGPKELECLPAYQEGINKHSCLTGRNHYQSLKQCRNACVKSHG